MKHITDKLAFVDLMLIKTPHLIRRYNSALLETCGLETKLNEFHIDCTGFSPEIAEELGDEDYLNPNGVNKRFIIVSIHQEKLPIVRQHFSSTVQFLKEFMRDNRRELLTLSAQDAIYGELDNNIYKIESISDVLNADEVTIRIDTPKKLIKTAKALIKRINDLKEQDIDQWLRVDNLQELADMTRHTGNVQHNSIIPSVNKYRKQCFFTHHYGGLYVFKGFPEGAITIIHCDDTLETKNASSDVNFIPMSKVKKVHKFLLDHNFIERLDNDGLLERKDRLRDKKFQVVADHLAMSQGSVTIDEATIKNYISKNFDQLPEFFYKLYQLTTAIDRDDQVDDRDEALIFYMSNVCDNPVGNANFALLNHLIAHFTPFSFLRMFTFNRELFMAKMAKCSDSQKAYIESYLLEHKEVIESLSRRAA